MLSTNSIFSPASGKSIMTPTQDIALGIYYLTMPSQQDKLAGKIAGKTPFGEESVPLFNDLPEVEFALAEGAVNVHTRIRFRNPDFGTAGRRHGDPARRTIETTVGRVVFNGIWPDEMGFVNEKVDKSRLGELILHCHQAVGQADTVISLDLLKTLGFKYATLAGVSMGIKDMIRPKAKNDIIAKAQGDVAKIERQMKAGAITAGERHNKIIDIWSTATDNVANELYKAIDENKTRENPNPTETNPVFMMADSKARGSKQQIRQLAGMRGLMANPSGEIIEYPILASFREGLSVLEYFISTHGARKGLADTALKTADAGYLTRKLVDVAQDVIITTQDCNTVNGIEIVDNEGRRRRRPPPAQRALGRIALNDIVDPSPAKPSSANEEIDEAACKRIEDAGKSVWIRSGLTCDARYGMCAPSATAATSPRADGRDRHGRGYHRRAVDRRARHAAHHAYVPHRRHRLHLGHRSRNRRRSNGRLQFATRRSATVRNDDGDDVVLNKNGFITIRDAIGPGTRARPRRSARSSCFG
jgi:DNA-directed RNA polymerase subunit beta'